MHPIITQSVRRRQLLVVARLTDPKVEHGTLLWEVVIEMWRAIVPSLPGLTEEEIDSALASL